ncbi:MAG TPA: hypothetical protein EYQ73_00560 [Candidatus Poseidoniales archaeon]|jgi:hypothetical protein|nr:MAG: hypothetical protein CXT71_01040 [Euryarchaeota archaeon]HIF45278.1 hypothetical protein [Candidatus Poseidoniales archaeon]HIL64672.1 hypothetical protein [Candidatus Poseidoniales archaeon]
MRVFAIFVLLLMLPLASAIGDLNQYAYSEHKSADSAPILVEWFHGENDDQYVSILEKMEADGDITLIHWRTNSSDEKSGWPSDDAQSRAMFHNISVFPAMTVDGFWVSLDDFDNFTGNINQNEVEIDFSIELIGSSEVELISIEGDWTNPQQLSGATQLHVFIIETQAEGNQGQSVNNLLRDWAPSSSFYFTNNTLNKWNTTITRDHLEGAGIELGGATHSNEYEMLLVMVGSFENDSNNRVLSIQRANLPTSWQSSQKGEVLTPALILSLLVICIIFIIQAELKREKGLPTLEGAWVGLNELEYNLTAGFDLEIGDMTLENGWKTNSRVPKGKVAGGQDLTGKMKVRGEGDFHMRLAVSVSDLGDWVLDLNLPEQKSNG